MEQPALSSPKRSWKELDPWGKMRARALASLAELNHLLLESKPVGPSAPRCVLLLKSLQDLWLGLDTVLDTQTLRLAKEQEKRVKEAVDHKHEMAKVRKEEQLAQASLVQPLDFSRSQVEDLPAALRALVEENRALKSKLRGYKQRAVRAEGLVKDAEGAIITLELDNARLNMLIKDCSVTPQQVALMQKTAGLNSGKDEIIKGLEQRLRVVTEKAASDKRQYTQQVKGLHRKLAIIQDNHEFILAAYSQPVTYLAPLPASPGATRRDPSAGLVPEMDSEVLSQYGVTPESSRQSAMGQGRMHKAYPGQQRVHPDVVRAIVGPAAVKTATGAAGVLPALHGDGGYSVSSTHPGRSPHKRAAGPRAAGVVPPSQRAAPMQVLTPGEAPAPAFKERLHASYVAQGGSDPTLVRAVNNSNSLVMRMLPTPQPSWQSSSAAPPPATTSPTHVTAVPSYVLTKQPSGQSSSSPYLPRTSGAAGRQGSPGQGLRVLVQPSESSLHSPTKPAAPGGSAEPSPQVAPEPPSPGTLPPLTPNGRPASRLAAAAAAAAADPAIAALEPPASLKPAEPVTPAAADGAEAAPPAAEPQPAAPTDTLEPQAEAVADAVPESESQQEEADDAAGSSTVPPVEPAGTAAAAAEGEGGGGGAEAASEAPAEGEPAAQGDDVRKDGE